MPQHEVMTQGIHTWSFPTRILFGVGAASRTGQEATRLGAKVALIVSDGGVAAAGVLEPIESALNDQGVAVHRALEVSSNPTEGEVLRATALYRDAGADCVIGVGGGSPLDVAKLVRLAVTHPGPLAQYDDAKGGSDRIIHPMPPMIAVPTTAGTGSEVGRSGVATIDGTKAVIFSPALMPNVAILDPLVTTKLPPHLTAATGMDALTHCIEAYCATGYHPMADALALHGIALCHQSLAHAVQRPDDLDARGDMLVAATIGAVAFQKGLGACHSLAHPLSTEFGMHHGLANAQCLPAVLDFNRSAVPAHLAEVALRLGVDGSNEALLTSKCAAAVRKLRDTVGITKGLASHGVTRADLGRLATLAYADACHQLNPRPCTEQDLLALYTSSYQEGEA